MSIAISEGQDGGDTCLCSPPAPPEPEKRAAKSGWAFESGRSAGRVSLQDRLRRQLEDRPMSFHHWMDACLYDPKEGYYTRSDRRPRTGPTADADFATSPTLHPFFAQCVAREAFQLWQAMGAPPDFRIVEFGGGHGDLARDGLAWLRRHHGWQPAWLHVELSKKHRTAQAGPGVDHVDALPEAFVGLVVAHEFLDALPVHLLERREHGWAELAVAIQDDGLGLVAMPADPDAVAAAPEVAAGHRVAANARARVWFHEVGRRLESGGVVVVDYGGEGRALWDRDPEWGTVRTFRHHQDGGSPLEEPGHKDITSSIDFAQCRQWAREAGLEQASLETQEEFLLRHGVLEALNAIDRTSLDGASAYLRLRQMLIPHAGGMGHAFRISIYKG